MFKIAGLFLVCGGTDAPALHFISAAEKEALYQRQSIASTANGMRQALRLHFGMDALYALPAWRTDCMQTVALEYDGPDAVAVRGMAAALALGMDPHGKPDGKPGNDGGAPVKPAPRKPKPAGGAGGFFDTISAGNSASA